MSENIFYTLITLILCTFLILSFKTCANQETEQVKIYTEAGYYQTTVKGNSSLVWFPIGVTNE